MTRNHPYIRPGYEPIEIASPPVYDAVIPAAEKSETNAVALWVDDNSPSPTISVTDEVAGEKEKAPDAAVNDNGISAKTTIFASLHHAANDRKSLFKRLVPGVGLVAGIAALFGVMAADGSNATQSVTDSIKRDVQAIATPVLKVNGVPNNMAPMLDVYYYPQPLTTDRVITETDPAGCQWKVAFDGAVNIPKGRYPLLDEKRVHKCTDSTRAARPDVAKTPRGAGPQGKPGTSMAIINVIDPATGRTDTQALASLGGAAEPSLDKTAIDQIIKNEIARAVAQKAQPARVASRNNRPAIMPGMNQGPISSMPSMPGNAGPAGDDRPAYIPYIPGQPYTPPASIQRRPGPQAGATPLRSIKPRAAQVVAPGIVQREAPPPIQSAKPGGTPTELRVRPAAPQPQVGANAVPNGSPLG